MNIFHCKIPLRFRYYQDSALEVSESPNNLVSIVYRKCQNVVLISRKSNIDVSIIDKISVVEKYLV